MTEQTSGQGAPVLDAVWAQLDALEHKLNLLAGQAIGDIPFSDGDNMTFSPAWAELMLRELHANHRETFGACVQAITTGIRQAKRGRPAGGSNNGI